MTTAGNSNTLLARLAVLVSAFAGAFRMRGLKAILLMGTTSLTIAGCDIAYGITGEKKISGSPGDDACILSAIQQTPGVKGVWMDSEKNKQTLLVGDGPVDDSVIRYFTYNVGGKFSPTFMVEEYYGGKIKYSNYMLSLNIKIPVSEIQAAMPVMQSVNEHISHSCQLDISDIKERQF